MHRSVARPLGRRTFLLSLSGVTALASACRGASLAEADGYVPGRLSSRPRAPDRTAAPQRGMQPLGLASGRDGLVYLPAAYRGNRPLPLVMLLHGSDTAAVDALPILRDFAEATPFILLVPESRQRTWDIVLGRFGADVDFIDRALAQTFARYAIDSGRMALAGFSDGASEALSLGITNGVMFPLIMAFSPGLVASTRGYGHPKVFDAYGDRDHIFPLDTSRTVVRQLRRAGLDVTERQFVGDHGVPPEIAAEAISWLTRHWE
ncbi:MAG: alpha/beta hydrolase-fold protein [Gemmatimonadaceae bacterium]